MKISVTTEESLNMWLENLSKGKKLENASLNVAFVEGRQISVDSLER